MVLITPMYLNGGQWCKPTQSNSKIVPSIKSWHKVGFGLGCSNTLICFKLNYSLSVTYMFMVPVLLEGEPPYQPKVFCNLKHIFLWEGSFLPSFITFLQSLIKKNLPIAWCFHLHVLQLGQCILCNRDRWISSRHGLKHEQLTLDCLPAQSTFLVCFSLAKCQPDFLWLALLFILLSIILFIYFFLLLTIKMRYVKQTTSRPYSSIFHLCYGSLHLL